MKYFAQRWAKNKAIINKWNWKGSNWAFIKGENGFSICLVPQKYTKIDELPDGDIVWLVPERGPSIYEVAEFRHFLENFDISDKQLQIVVCLPHDQSEKEANETIDEIAKMAKPAVPDNVDATVEIVWLSREGINTADMWFKDILFKGFKHD